MEQVFQHTSVLPVETMEAMAPKAGGVYLDMTLGGAGHSSQILAKSSPDGMLYAVDRDKDAVNFAQGRLEPYAGRFEIRCCRFSEVSEWVGQGICDGVLMDLGISSPQVDWGHRGFSFLKDGNLDMRMGADDEVTAADIVNQWSEDELIRIFREYGEEPRSRRIAQAIVEARSVKPFETTLELAGCIEKLLGNRGDKKHPATKVFQALRLQVNDELGQLAQGLVAAWSVLKVGGRLVTISFHSLEARMVKRFGNHWSRDYKPGDAMDTPGLRTPKESVASWSPRRAVKPTAEETKRNPRSRSAQLRTIVKLRNLPSGEEMDWQKQPFDLKSAKRFGS
jgi:16S rRNA (cytosine1402-N4)-methyltransferase